MADQLKQTERGFSLLEAVISAAVLGVGMMGLASLHTNSIRGEARAMVYSETQDLASEVGNYLAGLPYERVNNLLSACGETSERCTTADGLLVNTPPDVCNFPVGDTPFAGDSAGRRVLINELPTMSGENTGTRVALRWQASQATLEGAGLLTVRVCTLGDRGAGSGRVLHELAITRVVLD